MHSLDVVVQGEWREGRGWRERSGARYPKEQRAGRNDKRKPQQQGIIFVIAARTSRSKCWKRRRSLIPLRSRASRAGTRSPPPLLQGKPVLQKIARFLHLLLKYASLFVLEDESWSARSDVATPLGTLQETKSALAPHFASPNPGHPNRLSSGNHRAVPPTLSPLLMLVIQIDALRNQASAAPSTSQRRCSPRTPTPSQGDKQHLRQRSTERALAWL